ncbi:MAG: hypothetical protein DMG23_15220 [Acidobacteria bacterium]|nr:MAG: hypothetical protein DMG23_15220 [Acidobacteriota bacterium]
MRFRAHLALMVLGAVLLVAAPRARTQQGTTPKPFDLIEWSGGKFIYGVDYYPEAWDESQWEKDATMMQAAGINFVRLAEFAWAKMEPEAGRFDFGWLDRALKVLNSHGIRAVLGTPTASPPAWLYETMRESWAGKLTTSWATPTATTVTAKPHSRSGAKRSTGLWTR